MSGIARCALWKKMTASLSLLGGLAAFSGNCLAGGADNLSLSPASLGFTGASSAAADGPDTVYFNPAGMAHLKTSLVSNGLTIVSARMNVRDDGTTRVQDPRQPPCGDGYSGTCARPDSTGPAGSFLPGFQPIPNLYVVKPVDDMLTLGLGIFTPIGAKVSYKGDWFGSGTLQKGTVETVNFNPSLALRFDDKHSIGMGVSLEVVHVYQQASVDIPQAGKYYADVILQDANNAGLLGIPVGSVLPLGDLYQTLVPGPGKDFLGSLLTQTSGIGGTGQISYEGFGFGLGWNVGYLYQFDDHTRLSLAYRSEIEMKVKGDYDWDLSKVSGTIPNPQNLSQTASASQYLATYYRPDSTGRTTVIDPQRLSLGMFHSLSPRWDLMADISWTNNSVIKELRLSIDDRKDPNGNTIHQGDTVIPQYWRDTFRVSVGAANHVTDKLTLKGGLAYDQSPVHDDRYRHPGGPDSDRLILAFGAGLKLPARTVLDIGYSLVFLDNAKSRYHEHCTINYYERPDNSAGPKDECTANGGDFRASYSNGRIHVLAASLTKPL